MQIQAQFVMQKGNGSWNKLGCETARSVSYAELVLLTRALTFKTKVIPPGEFDARQTENSSGQ